MSKFGVSVALSLFQDIGIKAVAKILGLASEFYLCPICKTTASWEPTIHTGLVETFKVSAAKFPQDGSLHPGSRGENRQTTSRVTLLFPQPQDTKCQGEKGGTQVEDFWSIGDFAGYHFLHACSGKLN